MVLIKVVKEAEVSSVLYNKNQRDILLKTYLSDVNNDTDFIRYLSDFIEEYLNDKPEKIPENINLKFQNIVDYNDIIYPITIPLPKNYNILTETETNQLGSNNIIRKNQIIKTLQIRKNILQTNQANEIIFNKANINSKYFYFRNYYSNEEIYIVGFIPIDILVTNYNISLSELNIQNENIENLQINENILSTNLLLYSKYDLNKSDFDLGGNINYKIDKKQLSEINNKLYNELNFVKNLYKIIHGYYLSKLDRIYKLPDKIITKEGVYKYVNNLLYSYPNIDNEHNIKQIKIFIDELKKIRGYKIGNIGDLELPYLLYGTNLYDVFYFVLLEGYQSKKIKRILLDEVIAIQNLKYRQEIEKISDEIETEFLLYLTLLEKNFKNWKEIEQKILLFHITTTDRLKEIITKSELKLLENLYEQKRQEWENINSNNCEHLIFLRKFTEENEFYKKKDNLNKLSKFFGDKIDQQIKCKKCKFTIICNHFIEIFGKSYDDRIAILEKKYIGEKPIDNLYYCKYCAAELYRIETFDGNMEEIYAELEKSKSVQDSFESTNDDDDIGSIIWGIIKFALNDIKFKIEINETILIGTILKTIFPKIKEIYLSFQKANQLSIDKYASLLRLYTYIYVMWYFMLAMQTNNNIQFADKYDKLIPSQYKRKMKSVKGESLNINELVNILNKIVKIRWKTSITNVNDITVIYKKVNLFYKNISDEKDKFTFIDLISTDSTSNIEQIILTSSEYQFMLKIWNISNIKKNKSLMNPFKGLTTIFPDIKKLKITNYFDNILSPDFTNFKEDYEILLKYIYIYLFDHKTRQAYYDYLDNEITENKETELLPELNEPTNRQVITNSKIEELEQNENINIYSNDENINIENTKSAKSKSKKLGGIKIKQSEQNKQTKIIQSDKSNKQNEMDKFGEIIKFINDYSIKNQIILISTDLKPLIFLPYKISYKPRILTDIRYLIDKSGKFQRWIPDDSTLKLTKGEIEKIQKSIIEKNKKNEIVLNPFAPKNYYSYYDEKLLYSNALKQNDKEIYAVYMKYHKNFGKGDYKWIVEQLKVTFEYIKNETPKTFIYNENYINKLSIFNVNVNNLHYLGYTENLNQIDIERGLPELPEIKSRFDIRIQKLDNYIRMFIIYYNLLKYDYENQIIQSFLTKTKYDIKKYMTNREKLIDITGENIEKNQIDYIKEYPKIFSKWTGIGIFHWQVKYFVDILLFLYHQKLDLYAEFTKYMIKLIIKDDELYTNYDKTQLNLELIELNAIEEDMDYIEFENDINARNYASYDDFDYNPENEEDNEYESNDDHI